MLENYWKLLKIYENLVKEIRLCLTCCIQGRDNIKLLYLPFGVCEIGYKSGLLISQMPLIQPRKVLNNFTLGESILSYFDWIK